MLDPLLFLSTATLKKMLQSAPFGAKSKRISLIADIAMIAKRSNQSGRYLEVYEEAGLVGVSARDAAQTTLRAPGQPTITGFPRSSGLSRCSTDA